MRPTRHRGVGVSKQVDETSKTCAVQQAFVVQTRLSRRGGAAGGSTCGTCSSGSLCYQAHIRARQPCIGFERQPAGSCRVHTSANWPGSHIGPQLKLANLHQERLVPPASGHVLQAWRGREKQQAHAWNKPASSRRCDAEGGGEGAGGCRGAAPTQLQGRAAPTQLQGRAAPTQPPGAFHCKPPVKQKANPGKQPTLE